MSNYEAEQEQLSTFKNMLTSNGKKQRIPFLLVTLYLFVLGIGNLVLFFFLYENFGHVFLIPMFFIFIYVFFASICSILHRLHDIGISSWWLILIIIPYLNTLFLCFLLLKKGQVLPSKTDNEPSLTKALFNDGDQNSMLSKPPQLSNSISQRIEPTFSNPRR
jgi:uncharacterized membrane protein YhaH (DUF805 family)